MSWAVGTFDAGDGPFPGIVVDEARVHEVTAVAPTVRALLDRWDEALPHLKQAASREGGLALDEVEVLAPIEPRQILQAGANYYKHVLDIIVAERRAQGVDEETARAEGRRIMDARVAGGEPYVFLGAVGRDLRAVRRRPPAAAGEASTTGSSSSVAVLGPGGAVAGYTIANDLSTRDLGLPRGPEGDRHRLAARQERRRRSCPRPVDRAGGSSSIPAQLQVTLRLNGEDDAGAESTEDMIFDVERLRAGTVAERLRLFPGDLLLTGSPAGNGDPTGTASCRRVT